jgi:endonuclease/exonuclease/phosphatase family metal-dependent hydrolase
MNHRNQKITIISLILYVLCSAQYPDKIRVMTYNINAEKHGSGSYKDIADVINEIDPDIAGLQKLDSCNSRNPKDVLKWLGEQTARKTAYAPAIKDFENSGGSYGVGFLSRQSPVSIRKLWIEHTKKEQDRAALQIGVTMAGENVRVIVTHLAHEGSSYRMAQMQKIIFWIDSISTDDPVVIMADFNAKPDENSMKLLESAGYGYVKGSKGEILDTSANQGINHILFRPSSRWSVIAAGNPACSASNRNPVWADIELLDPVIVTRADPAIANHRRTFQIIKGDKLLYYKLYYPASISIVVFNLTGRKCAEQHYRHCGGIHPVSFDNFNLSDGLYRCVISADGISISENVMIMR